MRLCTVAIHTIAMSYLGGLATEVAGARDGPTGRTSEQQSVQERRTKDEADLYTYAKRESLDLSTHTSEEQEEYIPPKPQLFNLADLIVKGPGDGDTFAERIAKCVIQIQPGTVNSSSA